MFRQLLRGFPGGAVDPLQLGPGLIAAPVGAGHAFELKGLGVELAGVGHVGAGAEVPPVLTEGVEADGLVNAGQYLQLVGLVLGLDLRLRLGAAHLLALERQLFIDDPDHLLLDRLQVGFVEGIGAVEVVVEAGLGPGTDRDLGLGEQLLDRHGQHVAHRVADAQQLGAFAGFRQNKRRGNRPFLLG